VPYDHWKRPPHGGTDEDSRQANGFLPEPAVVLGALRDETAPAVSVFLRHAEARTEHIADYLAEVALGDATEIILADRFPDLLLLLSQLAPLLQAGIATSSHWSAGELEARLTDGPDGNGSDGG
jgi:hypothetical protein